MGYIPDSSTNRGGVAALIASLLLHLLLLGLPRFAAPPEPADPPMMRVIPPDETQRESFFGDASPVDDKPAPRQPNPPPQPPLGAVQADPAPPPVTAQVQPPEPESAQPPEPPPLEEPRADLRELALATVAPPTPTPRPTRTRTPPPTATPPRTATPRPTAPSQPAATKRVEQPRPTTQPQPTRDWFADFNRERRGTIAMADPRNEPVAPADRRYEVKADGSLTIYVGEGRRGTRAEIDFGTHPAAVINQVLEPYGGWYWEGFLRSVESSGASGDLQVSGVVRGGQRLSRVSRGGPGYYVRIHWGDQQRLGRALEALVNQALADRDMGADTALRRAVIGIRLHNQSYQFYVQSLQPEAQGTSP